EQVARARTRAAQMVPTPERIPSGPHASEHEPLAHDRHDQEQRKNRDGACPRPSGGRKLRMSVSDKEEVNQIWRDPLDAPEAELEIQPGGLQNAGKEMPS